MKNKYIDYVVSILTALLGVAVLQLVFFPIVANKISSTNFGELLLIFAIVNVFSLVFGNTLNNIRLINNDKYEDVEENSYSFFLLIIVLINALLLFLVLLILKLNSLSILLIVAWSTLLLIRSYAIVEYRKKLKFNKILIITMINSFFLLISVITCLHFNINYYFSFVISELIPVLYLLIDTKILKEKVRNKISTTMYLDYLKLFFSNVLNNLINYIDRFVLSFILGKHFVAVFFAATILGKFSTLIIQPISNVILSYNSLEKEVFHLKKFKPMFFINIIVSVVVSVIISLISIPVLNVLYRKLFEQSVEILFIANLAVVLLAASTILQSYIMSFADFIEQIKLNASFLIIFALLIYPLTYFYGIEGFCYCLLISTIVKYITIYLIAKKIFIVK